MTRKEYGMAATQIGDYRLEALLGSGGMGEVHRAYDTRRNRRVALKLLSADLADDREYRERFRRESDAAARLNEPHVIPIHDYGEIEGRLFIDMRLVDGQDLGRILEQSGPITPERAVSIVSQIAAALDAAHSHDLVHRDIKPANVLITVDQGGYFAYLVDFGVAYASASPYQVVTRMGTTIGTVEYMAPERFDGKPIDRRVDIYALACMLHECLTAMRPFSGDSLPALMRAHLYDPPPKTSVLRPGIPPALDDVVARGMAKDPGDRYRTAGELAEAARAALTARPQVPPSSSSGSGDFGPEPPDPPDRQAAPPTVHAWSGGTPPGPPGPPGPPSWAPGVGYPPPRRRGRGALVVGLAILIPAVVLSVVFGLVGVYILAADGTAPTSASQTSDTSVPLTSPAPNPAGTQTVTELFSAPENGACTNRPTGSTYSITTYDVEVLECRQGTGVIRYFYKYSGIDRAGWLVDVRSGRSYYKYDNLTLDTSAPSPCFDTYTATRKQDNVTNNTALLVFRSSPFVAEVYQDATVSELADVVRAGVSWTDNDVVC
ncbi:MAG: serine/threonine-protein kinase [Pseudonocardiaceae bacterium]